MTGPLVSQSMNMDGEEVKKDVPATQRRDRSPIEEAFSKLKTALRRAGARTNEALEEAIAQALLTITVQDAQGWFQHRGYHPPQERKS